jgi:serine/threonine protein kinase
VDLIPRLDSAASRLLAALTNVPLPPPPAAGVSHRDIKLDNLLLHWDQGAKQPLLKLCDFGVSQLQGAKAGKTSVGTLGYMAPEVLR